MLHLDVEEIANNRADENLSGTLSLEVWALANPYQGGDFNGCLVISTEIGELRGQQKLRQCHYEVPMQSPAEGEWYLVLMLREWGNGGYATRDHINFPHPIKAQYKLMLSLDGVPALYRP